MSTIDVKYSVELFLYIYTDPDDLIRFGDEDLGFAYYKFGDNDLPINY